MKKAEIILATFGILIVVGGTIAMFTTDTTAKTVAKNATVLETEKTEAATPPKKAAAPALTKQKETMTDGKPTYFIKKDIKVEDAFEYMSVEDLNDELPHKKNVEPIAAFTMKAGSIKNLRKGDSIVLPEINNAEYELKVTDRTLNADGSVTSTAKIEGYDSLNLSLMTEGTNTAFMTISSEDGVFQIEVVNGKGYVYDMNDIKRAYIDYTKTDEMRIPGSDDHREHDHRE